VGNNGQPTFRSEDGARQSSPDITLHSVGLRIEGWSTTQRLTSPHLPILFVVRDGRNSDGGIERPRTRARQTSYSFKVMEQEDWRRFNSELRRALGKWVPPKGVGRDRSVEWLNRRMVGCIVKAAQKTIPRGCRSDPVPWWDPEIDEEMRVRDQLEDHIDGDPESRRLWVEAQDRVRRIIVEKRGAFWKSFTGQLSYSTMPSATARVIRAIGREPRISTVPVMLKKNGKVLASDKDKAEALNSQYAAVSSRPSRKARGIVSVGAVAADRRGSRVASLVSRLTIRSRGLVARSYGLP
jgi:hypothetical protein